ncbi:TonB-dependent siderophore receptor [Thauera linaloolentis]|uniref:TonB-dependent siderophore receptor n=1 Tax=Thauera linaloolentis (strain DSM 12138 / JCM 21573 / CCUG 41526 / CIP 105981 / IAM 15112 / NBRC 102519 / 47Lol) TaxID=1123367 RepID=N6ZES4_THAL4|nr:TonB-dependent siderophore receptor [Thauera linaloolentis]ENO90664.1 TonB-dependent siderophore receptor [Thauera linaloolentis 47Lol = DSM 12138]MCM8565572.1 TonB-dependent siderophore receptor [Thauera linaloolentis]
MSPCPAPARRLSIPLRPTLLALALGLSFVPAHAQQNPSAQVQTPRQWSLPAQPLGSTLARIASEGGLALSIDAELVRGLTAPAVQGHYNAAQAARAALQGSGLGLTPTASGALTLRRLPVSGEAVLAPVSVIARPERSAITENTGSYTTGVTSTATKMNLSIRETPQSISVVTRQRMDDQELTNITKVLEQTPGVTISRDVGERFNIYSRGREINKFQYDGLTTHVESQTQNMSQNLADMSIYDKVEIVRGATGLMTGAGYPSGMVNMVRKRPTKEFQASLTGSIGRWDDYRGSVDVSGPLVEGGRLRGRLIGAKQDNNSFTDYYSQKRDVLYGVAEADITNSTTLRLGIDYQRYEVNGGADVPAIYTDGGQTNFPRSTTAVSKHQNEKFETTNYFFNIDQALANDWKLVVSGNYMDADRKFSGSTFMENYTGSAMDRETGQMDIAIVGKLTNPINQKSAAINLQGPFSLFGREHQAIVGYEFSRYKSNWVSPYSAIYTTGTLSDIQELSPSLTKKPTPSIQDFYNIQRGYYGVLRLNPVDKLHVLLGARVSDYIYYSAWNGSKSGYQKSGEVTPYAGLVYDLTPEQSVYISYTDIFMPNTVVDINHKIIDPQVGSNYEAGWKGEFYDGRLNANVAIYQSKADNATEFAGRDDSGRAYYRAVDGVKTEGIDIELAGEVLPGWNVSGSYSHTKSEDAAGARRLPEHPLDTVKLWNTYSFSGNFQGLTIGGGARWISKTSADYASLSSKTRQDDYVVVDLMARYRINQHLSAMLNISNLFDKKYYTGLGQTGFSFYGQPRNLTLGARYDF